VVVSVAQSARISPAKLLIPLAYASLIGGMLTLIGTPPNIVVSDQLRAATGTPFAFFSFTPVGALMMAIGIGYMLLIGRHLLPNRTRIAELAAESDPADVNSLLESYQLPGNLYRLRVRQASPLVGQTPAQAELRTRYHVNILALQHAAHGRQAQQPTQPAQPDTPLQADDILVVKGSSQHVNQLAQEQLLGIQPAEDAAGNLIARELGIVEVLLTPRSRLIGRTLRDARFRDTYGVTVLAIMRLGEPVSGLTSQTELRFGDTLLVQATWAQIGELRREHNDFVVVGEPRGVETARYDTRRAPLALAIMVAMLAIITIEALPTVTAVLLAAVLMVLTRCVVIEDVYNTMSWESLVLIAAMLPMATALEITGGMIFIADAITGTLGSIGPLAVLAGIFALTSLFSQFISNTATTVLMAPIALQAAAGLGIAPEPLLMAAAVAASTAFATPIASPVNTLVLGPGGYRFGDFIRVGIPLQILLLLVSVLILPLLFPF
ncbi:MAG TPA: SLC13 family permease, partial [Roseiflexaceae bacterium]|nr:SLC13 family permease [Roseiflexaceae bacterium]